MGAPWGDDDPLRRAGASPRYPEECIGQREAFAQLSGFRWQDGRMQWKIPEGYSARQCSDCIRPPPRCRGQPKGKRPFRDYFSRFLKQIQVFVWWCSWKRGMWIEQSHQFRKVVDGLNQPSIYLIFANRKHRLVLVVVFSFDQCPWVAFVHQRFIWEWVKNPEWVKTLLLRLMTQLKPFKKTTACSW